MDQPLRKRPWTIPLVLFIGLAVLYGPHRTNEHMIDDSEFLLGTHQNQFQSVSDYFTDPHGHHYIPLYYLVNTQFFKYLGQRRDIQRLLMVLLFYGNCLLLYGLYRKWIPSGKAAGLAVLLFAFHPMNADMLGPVSNIFLLGYSFFLLLAFHGICRAADLKQQSSAVVWGALVCYVLALLHYDNALLFPGVLILYLMLVKKNSFLRSLRISGAFWLVAVAYFFLWLFFVKSSASSGQYFRALGLSSLSWLATNAELAGWYLGNLFWPRDIVYLYELTPLQAGMWWRAGFFLVLIAVCGYLCAVHWKRSLKTFLLGWFGLDFLILLPASIAHPAFGMVLEHHWFYFSSMAFYLLLVLVLWEWQPKLLPLAGRLLVIVLLGMSVCQSKLLLMAARTEAGYARRWLAVCPRNMMALRILGDYYVYKAPVKDYERGADYYRKIVETTGYDRAPVYDWIGNAYWFQGDDSRAERYYLKSLAVRPTATTYTNLAELYLSNNLPKAACDSLKHAAVLDSADPRVHALAKKANAADTCP
ncbi:MAG: hypothetical protein K8I00_08080 [Candidatus Omnitrophica bacterium]|nr:hypothetical protein [Candidatus Omnitrophota bacterium]